MDDAIDGRRARRFRWRLPDQSTGDEPEDEPEDVPSPSSEEVREEAEILAMHVREVWALRHPATQARAMPALCERADRVGLGIVALDPGAATALAVLYARHWPTLSEEARESAFLFGFATLDEAGLPDLLATIAATGNQRMSFVVGRALDRGEYAIPGLAARLAAALEGSTDPDVAELSVFWLAVCDEAEATPWVRAALRLPSVKCRTYALEIGVQRPGRLIRAEDVLWLLQDALLHPLPPEFDSGRRYEEALAEAVRLLRPGGGEAVVLRLLAGEGRHFRRERRHLGAGWALRALAAGWPERAVGEVDAWLASTQWFDRWQAIEAAAALPDEPARQRLLVAAGDFSHRVRESARDAWTRRFGEPCPASELAGLEAGLYGTLALERVVARVACLTSDDVPARRALARQLLAEAPDPAALRWLLQGLDDADLVGGAGGEDGLPRTREAWVPELRARWGAAAVDALLERARRETRSWYHGWGHALDRSAAALEPADCAAVAAVVAEAVRQGRCSADVSASLRRAGLPAHLTDELLARVLAAEDDDLSGREVFALALAVPTDPMRAALADRVAWALRSRTEAPLWALACLAGAWNAEPVVEALVEAMDADRSERPAPPWMTPAVEAARKLGRVDEAWTERHLRTPEAVVFDVLARLPREGGSPVIRELLLAALESGARGGAAAAAAAAALLWAQAIGPDDPRVPGIVARAPAGSRLTVCDRVAEQDPWPDWLRRELQALATLPDPVVVRALVDLVWMNRKHPEWSRLAEHAIRHHPDAEVRDTIALATRRSPSWERYWLPSSDDE